MIKIKISAPAGEGAYESIKSLIKGLKEDDSTNQIFVLDCIGEIPSDDVFFKDFKRVYKFSEAINCMDKFIIVKTQYSNAYSSVINQFQISKSKDINCNKKDYIIINVHDFDEV